MSDEHPAMIANDVFVVTVTGDGMVRLAITTPKSEVEMDMPHASALWLGNELVRAFQQLEPVIVEHWEHDIHGPLLEVGPDRGVSLDEDCDCPPDCAECEAEGVTR